MSKKTISSSFTVSTVEDGQSAPYYFQEWYAWSNDASTNSVTTAPSIGGSWQTSIPAKGSYAYLWRKSIRFVWNESTRSYSAEPAQYFRMSGTNGTSINTRGAVADASKRYSNGTAKLTNGTTITMQNGDCVVQEDTGHMWQWLTESGGWSDLGPFRGEPGKTYYTHVVWATNVAYSGTTVTTITGYTPAKTPDDTTHLWMGIHVDENSDDPTSGSDVILKSYTWSYTKGVDGTNVIVADIDNEMDGIQTDEKGKVIVATSITTRARIFNGSTQVTSGVTASNATLCGVTATPSISNGVATFSWTIPTTYTFTNGKATVTLTLSYNGNTYQVVFTLMATMGTAVYNLKPSQSEINVGRTSEGAYSPSSVSLSCTCLKAVGSNISTLSADNTIDGAYRVFFRRRTRSSQAWSIYYFYGNTTYKAYLTSLDVTTYDQVELILYKNTSSSSLSTITESNVVDRETVPVVADGAKGTQGNEGKQGEKGDPGIDGISPYSLTPQYTSVPIQCEAGGVTSDAMSNFAVGLTLRQGTTAKTISSVSGATVEVNKGNYTYPTCTTSLGSTDTLKMSIPAGTNKTSIAPLITVAVKVGSTVLASSSISLAFAQKGLPGDTASTIQPLRYYAGVWVQKVVASQYYYYTDTTAPIVKYGNNYYTLNNTAAARQGIPDTSAYTPTNTTYWTEVSYRAAQWIEVLFAYFARLGSAVFWGDYMFSAFGSFMTPSGAVVENMSYDDADAISAVNDTLGAGGDFSSCLWKPYFWINLSTGKVYMENAVIRGLITEWFQVVHDDGGDAQMLLLNGDEAHHVSFEPHTSPKALLLPMKEDVGGVVYKYAPPSILTATSKGFNGAGSSVRVVNQAMRMAAGATQQTCADSGVLLCADPRMFVPASYAYVNGAWQYAPKGVSQGGDILPDYDGFFLWNGIYAKFMLLPPGYMTRLTSLDNFDPETQENYRYWYVEGAFDLATVSMDVLIVPSNGNTCAISYDRNINPGPHHANSAMGFLCPAWLASGNASPGTLPLITIDLYGASLAMTKFYSS